ncbi:MAG: diaminopimelate decarboxylase [Planctomycetes bacterium]|nr:diaminopimelate decarboxylase [Planctomycetota bacterium]
MRPAALDDALLARLAREHGTPLYVYDAGTVEARIRDLAGFDRVRYAQKANSNLAVLGVVKRAGAFVDAVSAGEIERALRAGFDPRTIVFTADLFDRAALAALARYRCPVNLGSPFQVEQYAALGTGTDVILRVNPGFGHGHGRKVNTGGESSKHGIWHTELESVVARARRASLRVRGLHVHIGSGADFENLARVREALRRLAPVAGPDLAVISAGGGLSIPYREGEERVDVARYVREWLETKRAIEDDLGRAIELECEPGRYLTAECGVLVAEVRGMKRSGSVDYVLIDAGFHTLVRPAMYGAYHRVTAIGKPAAPSKPTVVAGPLCESGDVMTQKDGGLLDPQPLPELATGDLVCVHDAGAYAMAMASNYNTQPFPAEVLVDGGRARLVRRRQTFDALLADETGLEA